MGEYMTLTMKPVFFRFRTASKDIRPDMRIVAKEFANFILENGIIASHEFNPQKKICSDEYEWIFNLYAYCPDRSLP